MIAVECEEVHPEGALNEVFSCVCPEVVSGH